MKEEVHTFVDLSAFIFTLSSERKNIPSSHIKQLHKLKMEVTTANPYILKGEDGGIRCQAISCKLINTNQLVMLERSYNDLGIIVHVPSFFKILFNFPNGLSFYL